MNTYKGYQNMKYYNSSRAARLIDPQLGRNKLMRFLRQIGFLSDQNIPSQRYIDMGYCKVEYIDIKGGGRTIHKNDPVVRYYMKGIEFLKEQFKKYQGE